jgi:uncharacterized 2Fe-2S/4Fe-4S cluster protein (DUF4445 family)
MTTHTLEFVTESGQATKIQVPHGISLSDAALEAGVELNIPCGGQGRCGRCAVIVEEGAVRRRSTLRLSAADVEAGYALACQTVAEGNARISVPPQEKIERLLETDKTAAKITVPFAYDPALHQAIRRVCLPIDPPSLADSTDDMSRLRRTLAQQAGIDDVRARLSVLQKLAGALRSDHWNVTAVIETDTWDMPNGPPRLVDVLSGDRCDENWGLAIDIGTTSNVVYLVNLINGDVVQQAADYNGQIRRGEDVISRMIYAGKNGGLEELQKLVVDTLNKLILRVARRQGIEVEEIHKAVVAGNSTMVHLFLALPPQSIRLEPYVTTVNQVPSVRAAEVDLAINPEATVDCLPGVASYVGADITSGVVSSGMVDVGDITLFIDVGTNGEMVLGDGSWLITCACSAGPAFEGAGVVDGMRATRGAIEEVWINAATAEPTYRVIGGGKPRGICGSGLISLLAEMFITDVIDKSGNLNKIKDSPRIRVGEHGDEYVVAWAAETEHGQDITITHPDIDNLLRAKAAIYAGFASLAQSVGVDMSDVSQLFIGGAFGQYLNVEKSVQIGLLPDLPWDKFRFLGNTSIKGAYMALLSRETRAEIEAAATKMTYLELSADNTFYDQFTSALFLPHTDIDRFPSVAVVLGEKSS